MPAVPEQQEGVGHSQLPAGRVGVSHAVLGRAGVAGVGEEGDEAVREDVQLRGRAAEAGAAAACAPRLLPPEGAVTGPRASVSPGTRHSHVATPRNRVPPCSLELLLSNRPRLKFPDSLSTRGRSQPLHTHRRSLSPKRSDEWGKSQHCVKSSVISTVEQMHKNRGKHSQEAGSFRGTRSRGATSPPPHPRPAPRSESDRTARLTDHSSSALGHSPTPGPATGGGAGWPDRRAERHAAARSDHTKRRGRQAARRAARGTLESASESAVTEQSGTGRPGAEGACGCRTLTVLLTGASKASEHRNSCAHSLCVNSSS